MRPSPGRACALLVLTALAGCGGGTEPSDLPGRNVISGAGAVDTAGAESRPAAEGAAPRTARARPSPVGRSCSRRASASATPTPVRSSSLRSAAPSSSQASWIRPTPAAARRHGSSWDIARVRGGSGSPPPRAGSSPRPPIPSRREGWDTSSPRRMTAPCSSARTTDRASTQDLTMAICVTATTSPMSVSTGRSR